MVRTDGALGDTPRTSWNAVCAKSNFAEFTFHALE